MASREELEQQKLHHYECIRSINTRLNALLPISRLPPEVLSEIFLRIAGYRPGHASRPPKVRAWMRVTHVCTHWREIALQCAELWSRLDVPSIPELLALFLLRSKDTPLTMTLSFRPLRLPGMRMLESSEDVILLALSALHRVRMLSVDASWKPADVILQQLGSRAPLLESLTISNASSNSELRASLARMLSHPESNRLRILETEFYCFTWRDVLFDGLTRLRVRGNGGHRDSSLTCFFNALASMSQLEELELTEVFVRRFQSQRDGSSTTIPNLAVPITLPCLRRLLTYRESTSTTTTLLNNLHTPSLLHLSVEVVQGDLKEDHVRLFAAMAHKAVTLGPFLTVEFSLNKLYETAIRAYRDVCQRSIDPKDDSTSAWLERHIPALEYHGRDGVDDVPLAEFCNLVPVGDVQTLLFGYAFPTAQDEWLNIARCVEGVTELRWHSTMNNVISPGKPLSEKLKDPGTGRVAFVLPNLRIFTMDRVNFWEEPERREEHRTRRTGVISELQDGFAQRAREGAEIDTLRILCARQLWEEDLERMREVVRCVESDGLPENLRGSQGSAFSPVTRTTNGREVIYINDSPGDGGGWSDEEDSEEYEGSDEEYEDPEEEYEGSDEEYEGSDEEYEGLDEEYNLCYY